MFICAKAIASLADITICVKEVRKKSDPRSFGESLVGADMGDDGDDEMSYLRPGILVGGSLGPVDAPKPIGSLG